MSAQSGSDRANPGSPYTREIADCVAAYETVFPDSDLHAFLTEVGIRSLAGEYFGAYGAITSAGDVEIDPTEALVSGLEIMAKPGLSGFVTRAALGTIASPNLHTWASLVHTRASLTQLGHDLKMW